MPLCLPQDAPVFVAFRLPGRRGKTTCKIPGICQDESYPLRAYKGLRGLQYGLRSGNSWETAGKQRETAGNKKLAFLKSHAFPHLPFSYRADNRPFLLPCLCLASPFRTIYKVLPVAKSLRLTSAVVFRWHEVRSRQGYLRQQLYKRRVFFRERGKPESSGQPEDESLPVGRASFALMLLFLSNAVNAREFIVGTSSVASVSFVDSTCNFRGVGRTQIFPDADA